ncbi:MAG: Ig-like domain-containing protein [Bacteroidota bacterium]
MKYIILNILMLLPFINGHAQGLDSIIVERYYLSNTADSNGSIGNLPAGSITYRIFVDMAPAYKFQAAYGNANHELRLATTTSFFNNEDRGAVTPTYTKPQARYNTVMLDSWLSVGAACTGNMGILKSQDNGLNTVVNLDGILQNANPLAGIPLSTQDGMIPGIPQSVTTVGIDNEIQIFDATSGAGNLFTTHNGAWSALNGAVGPTPENRVLIAQITTNGVFTFLLNIQIKDTVTNTVEQYVASNPIGSEIQNVSLSYCSNLLPIVSITAPLTGNALVGGNIVDITANANDQDGSIAKVEFYVNGLKIGEDVTAPYAYPWTCISGSDTLYAIATDNYGGQTTSDKVIITVGTVFVNNFNSLSQTIKLYPNPANDQLSLEMAFTGQSKVNNYTVYSISGARLLHKELGLIQNSIFEIIDISVIAKGTYILEIVTDNNVTSKRFTKN